MTSSLNIRLRVALKGIDPVINTAYLTLTEKMGYSDNLLALNRLESYRFTVGCLDVASTLQRLREFVSTQTIFYNRNKHNYFLDSEWNGQHHTEGTPIDRLESLAEQAARWSKVDESQDRDGQAAAARVILSENPIYRAEVLVEDIEPVAKRSLAAKLETELATTPVSVSELGTRWYLALRVESDDVAKRVTHEIAVTEGRNQGLLLNPNYQRYELLSLGKIDL
jgi:hypothetical protein